MIFQRFSLVVLSMAAPSIVCASELGPALETRRYRIQPHDTLSDVLDRTIIKPLPEGSPRPRIYGPRGLLEQTLTLNPDIQNPDFLLPDQEILLPVPTARRFAEPNPISAEPELSPEPRLAVTQAPSISEWMAYLRTGAEFFRVLEKNSAAANEASKLMNLPSLNVGFAWRPNSEDEHPLEFRFDGGVKRLWQQTSLPSPWLVSTALEGSGQYWGTALTYEQRAFASFSAATYDATGDISYLSRKVSFVSIAAGPAIGFRRARLEFLAGWAKVLTYERSTQLPLIRNGESGPSVSLRSRYDGLLSSRRLVLTVDGKFLSTLSDSGGVRLWSLGSGIEWRFR